MQLVLGVLQRELQLITLRGRSLHFCRVLRRFSADWIQQRLGSVALSFRLLEVRRTTEAGCDGPIFDSRSVSILCHLPRSWPCTRTAPFQREIRGQRLPQGSRPTCSCLPLHLRHLIPEGTYFRIMWVATATACHEFASSCTSVPLIVLLVPLLAGILSIAVS